MKSHKKEIITVAILMAAAVVIFAGILKPEATQTKKCSLIYIPKIRDNTNDFWTSVISGCKMAAEEYESDLEILAPDKEENIEEQNKLLKQQAQMQRVFQASQLLAQLCIKREEASTELAALMRQLAVKQEQIVS